MKTPNTQLMRQAADALSNRWGLAIGTFFVFTLIVGATSVVPERMTLLYATFPLVWLIFVYGPMILGISTFSLAIARNDEPKFCMLFAGFKQNYWKSIGVFLLMLCFVLLGMLLLIIPGFIVAFMLGLSFYILRDNPQIGVVDALKRSRKMMNGFKMKYFLLVLTFLGIYMLCALPLAIVMAFNISGLFIPSALVSAVGFFFVLPCMQVSVAKFYEDVKANNTDMA